MTLWHYMTWTRTRHRWGPHYSLATPWSKCETYTSKLKKLANGQNYEMAGDSLTNDAKEYSKSWRECELVCPPVNTDPRDHTSRNTYQGGKVPVARTMWWKEATSYKWLSVLIHWPNLANSWCCLSTIYFSNILLSKIGIPMQTVLHSFPVDLFSPWTFILAAKTFKSSLVRSPPNLSITFHLHCHSMHQGQWSRSPTGTSLTILSQRLHRKKHPSLLRIPQWVSRAPQILHRPLSCTRLSAHTCQAASPPLQVSFSGLKSSSVPLK